MATTEQNIKRYLKDISEKYETSHATEHSYRGILETLLKSIDPSHLDIINEPRAVTACGNPDYVILRRDLPLFPLGFIEAKDLAKDLNANQYKEQFNRYQEALDNLIITNYLTFQFFQKGKLEAEISLASLQGQTIKEHPENFAEFLDRIEQFCNFEPQSIKDPETLAELMAGKARLLKSILERALTFDETNQQTTPTELQQQYQVFKKILIHDLEPPQFADIYAQTIAYGFFAARLHDKTPKTFSRQEAAELIPATTPFLKNLFNHIAGLTIDNPIMRTVDNLAKTFCLTDIESLRLSFDKQYKGQDLIIHFYETFLAEYDPEIKKNRGVYYTPNAVVDFIVRGVDDLLKTKFKLKEGLASSDKTTVDLKASNDPNGKENTTKPVHKVQLLDPATGTGTFLVQVFKFIYDQQFATQKGAWQAYVKDHLLPRIHGFEILMAPYAVAHLKLDFFLNLQTDCQLDISQRFNIFLTNTLEDVTANTEGLFATWLSNEATAANAIKRDIPVMVIVGNPPYSGESMNKGDFIMDLMDDYKKEPGGITKLKERNPKWINDDYVKFMRYAQSLIEKNGEGIVAFINPHGYLDNPTFRGMRWSLLSTYDEIYIVDLHGNANKKETAPDGSKDENVFDIRQGVAINFFVKTGKKKAKDLAQVFHYDLYGRRQNKEQYLLEHSLKTVQFEKLPNVDPMYLMRPKDFKLQKKYNQSFAVTELFPLNSVGIVTARDKFSIHQSKQAVVQTIETFLSLDEAAAREQFALGKDTRDWKIAYAKADLKQHWHDQTKLTQINYRPFDTRWTYYTGQSKGFHCMPRNEVMRHFINGENVGLIFPRRSMDTGMPVFITKFIIDKRGAHSWAETISYVAPLYLYPETTKGTNGDHFTNGKREPNLNLKIVAKIAQGLGLSFVPEKFPPRPMDTPPTEGNSPPKNSSNGGEFAPIDMRDSSEEREFAPMDILDYCYAVLYSPVYRARYQEFLKIDFPRVPYPKDAKTFWQFVAVGRQLRLLHLLDGNAVKPLITTYPITGDNQISRRITAKDFAITDGKQQLGRVYINDEQYFGELPFAVWNYYIGGYQPAQKWLKDRVGQTLDFNAITHYQQIIAALAKTIDLQTKLAQYTW